MFNASIRYDELDKLVAKLQKSAADMPRIARNAINAAAPIVKEEFSRQTPRSNPLRNATQRNPWRTGRHAADDVMETGFKTRKDRQGIYKVIGYEPSDTSPHFYIKFFQTGRKVFNVRNWYYAVKHVITGNRNPDRGYKPREGEPRYFNGYQDSRPLTEKVMANVERKVLETMKESFIKEIL